MIKRHHFVARVPNETPDSPRQDGLAFDEWQLLVYESAHLSEGAISQDVRDVIERFPFTGEISIAAPNAQPSEVLNLVANGTGFQRTLLPGARQSVRLSILDFDSTRNILTRRLVSHNDGLDVGSELPEDVRYAWLFDLFHRHHCLVSAPEGIHFGKTSGKHSNLFLRAANSIVGTLECSLLSFFLLPFAGRLNPVKIYVDTGPLVAVGMALAAQCKRRNLWIEEPSVESFSSYDGLEKLSQAPSNHLILISASTSGGLESSLIERTNAADRIATIFYLQALQQHQGAGYRLCDLLENENSFYGYSAIETYANMHDCKWCKAGVPVAEFEGDQFLLQKRKTQLINISYHPYDQTKCAMKTLAYEFFKLTKSRDVISVSLTAGGHDGYRDVRIQTKPFIDLLLSTCQEFNNSLKRLSIQFPIDYLVSDDFSASTLCSLEAFGDVEVTEFGVHSSRDSVQRLATKNCGSVLVPFGLLVSMHEPRKINEILRTIVPDGNVRYVAGATIVETPEQFRQLAAALQTGAKGLNNFNLEPGYVVLLRKRFERVTTWEKEKDLLSKIVEADEELHNETPVEILERLSYLRQTGQSADQLFWKAQNQSSLRLQNNFVFLPVDYSESQADVYAVVSNLLSAAIQLNRNPQDRFSTDISRKSIRDSVYAESLIDPNNLLKFNDAILRASLLRAANSAELNYSGDLELSSVITSLVMHEITEWHFSRGQALMEFLISLATRHLLLCAQHVRQISEAIRKDCFLPQYVKRVAQALPMS